MDEPRARGLSLWLIPEGAVRDRVAALIVRLAGRFSTPTFLPHVTLLPGIEGRREPDVLSTSEALAAGLRTVPIDLLAVEGHGEPFRCLVARAAADEPLRAAHAAASRAFGREPDPAFLPHLSLVYGSLAEETKRALARELAPAVCGSFEAAALDVWRTEGPVADWREIGTFPLGGAGRP